ncbi:FAD-binding oxidoreductase [Xylanimonas ulmi]|uniref:FAD binding domain-containing protein n=1 Tax=Xylanimonas ulmi TaxID=228973 RepID=A0A4Q7M061_9MICO|nr:FAD-binding protein [Xylanibacterium ulmi]RZS61116.1 FAD binding domain-containing protein [Xylanibacterium ulmi]
MTIVMPPQARAALTAACAVHLPGDPGYDAARTPWNLTVDQRPAAVAEPADAAEVAAVVRAARAVGLRVAPQSTGHNATPLAARGLDDAVLVRLGRLRGVEVDPVRRVARVLGGTPAIDVVEAAARHGLAVLHGSSPDVGFAGLALGGGAFLYSRALGLTANSLAAVDLVTPDGDLRRVSATEHPDLFWAVRGGGGSFGVATAVEARLFPLADVHAGLMVWDVSRAREVLRAWARWAPGAPDEVTTTVRLLRVPPLPDVPEMLRGRHVVVLDGAVLDTDERAGDLLAPLRALDPEVDTFARVPAAAVARLHMDPEGPSPSVSASATLSALPDEAVDALLAAVDRTPGLMMVELRQLGGALSRAADGAGALATLPGQFLLFAVAIAPTPQDATRGRGEAACVVTALAPWETGRHYLAFAESAVDPRTGFDAHAWERLLAVRAAVDAERRLAANHPIA